MSITATTQRPLAVQGRLTVPWMTVIPLAVLMAYADGFWMVSLRGAVGAIERTQGPFASWLRESTIVLPVFVLAVLGALSLGARLFGPVLAGPKPVLGTAALTAVCGTLVGTAQMATSSAFDYHLQSRQLLLQNSLHNHGGAELVAQQQQFLAQQQQASLGLLVHSVGYGAGMVLVTNLVLVGWVLAMRGGRLGIHTDRSNSRNVSGIRLLTAVGFFASGGIHAAAVPDHLAAWPAAGAFFMVLAAAELVVAGRLLTRP